MFMYENEWLQWITNAYVACNTALSVFYFINEGCLDAYFVYATSDFARDRGLDTIWCHVGIQKKWMVNSCLSVRWKYVR